MPGVANRRLSVEPLEDRALPADFGMFGGDISAPVIPAAIALDSVETAETRSGLAFDSVATGASRSGLAFNAVLAIRSVPSFAMVAPSVPSAANRIRTPSASFLAPPAPAPVFRRATDPTAEPVARPEPEFDPTEVVAVKPKVAEEPLDEITLKLPPPPPQVVEYELPEAGDVTESDVVPTAPAARPVVEEFAATEVVPAEPVPSFAGDLPASPDLAEWAVAADQFLDSLGEALEDSAAPAAVWERIGYWAVSVGAVGVALEVARQRLRVRSPNPEAPTLVVRQ